MPVAVTSLLPIPSISSARKKIAPLSGSNGMRTAGRARRRGGSRARRGFCRRRARRRTQRRRRQFARGLQRRRGRARGLALIGPRGARQRGQRERERMKTQSAGHTHGHGGREESDANAKMLHSSLTRFRALPRAPRRRFPVRPMPSVAALPDARLDALTAWAASAIGTPDFTIAPASADASFRRYFRITPAAPWRGHATLIAMDAPPPQEDCRPFVHVAHLLAAAGVHAPAVLARRSRRGFLLLVRSRRSHLSRRARLQRSAPTLYADATEALIRWQRATRDGELPPTTKRCSRASSISFPDWYVAKHLGIELTPAQAATLAQRVPRSSSTTISRNRASSCTAITMRAT